MMKIGLNSLTVNNDITILNGVSALIDMYECSKPFYLEHKDVINKLDIPCDTMSSLITGTYDLHDAAGKKSFMHEFEETMQIAKDLGTTKLMFGLARYRTNINDDALKFFDELVDITNDNNLILMYEAISPKLYTNKFICNHKELINYTDQHKLKGIHVDFGTILAENESFVEIAKQGNVINIHFPFGEEDLSEVSGYNISIENYTGNKLTYDDVIDYLLDIR